MTTTDTNICPTPKGIEPGSDLISVDVYVFLKNRIENPLNPRAMHDRLLKYEHYT